MSPASPVLPDWPCGMSMPPADPFAGHQLDNT
jgi:hypothetical protein